MTVLRALQLKHLEPQCPPESTLIKRNNPPPRLDLEVTGAHVHYAASRISRVVLVLVGPMHVTVKRFCLGIVPIVIVLVTPLPP